MTHNKQQLTAARTTPRAFGYNLWIGSRKVLKLEQKFGQYLWVPLDIPRIEPDDAEKFAAWYFQTSKPIKKLQDDAAGPAIAANYGGATFDSVNSSGYQSVYWEMNHQPVFEMFPELAKQMEALPFDKPPEFTLWSSKRTVSLHRDQGPWCDLPASFRVMLYDQNEKQTLYIKDAPPNRDVYHPRFMLPRLPDTNTFAWNNLRAAHGSNFTGKRKILMVISQAPFNLDKYEDLLIRSIHKYGDVCLRTKHQQSDYIGE